MKILILLLGAFLLNTEVTHGQLLKKMKERAAQTAENKILNKTATATDKSIDKAEADIKKEGKKNSDGETTEAPSKKEDAEAPEKQTSAPVKSSPKGSSLKAFSNYDFVPGDKIIYQYDMAGERDAEIPGRMLVIDGNVEVQSYKGDKVLFFPVKSGISMYPNISGHNYLPDQYTIEFDVLMNGLDYKSSRLYLFFRKPENAGDKWYASAPYIVQLSGLSSGKGNVEFSIHKKEGGYLGGNREFTEAANSTDQDTWRKVAIYINKNIGKVYVDQYRVAIVNQIHEGAGMVSIDLINDYEPVMIKNIRIAKGGSDAYNKVITEGKFIAYGIQFDVNKAVLKPESMGTINEVFRMMSENADLKFEIGGHTDSDGAAATNVKLSEERAQSVKATLEGMGIDASRLTVKGYGSSKPIAENNSPENKARNRRVEFVKK